jgi:hypothetical protein
MMDERILYGRVTVNWTAETPIKVEQADSGEAGYDRITIGTDIALWPCYVMTDDAAVVAACDRMIEALNEMRLHALARAAVKP